MSVPIDLDHLNEMTDGDDEFRAELLEVYVTETSKTVVDVLSAFAENDYGRVSAGAHSIKGASANIGASDVVDAAFVVEQLAREQKLRVAAGKEADPIQLPENVERLKKEFELAKDYIQTTFSG